MVIIGAKGHAKEVLDVLLKNKEEKSIFLFDNLSKELPKTLYGGFGVIRNEEKLQLAFAQDPRFVLGIGNSKIRALLADKCTALGGKLHSVISKTATIGAFGVQLGKGLNVMHQVYISVDTRIKEGVLINAGANIHHDCIIGKYTEICPNVTLTGNVEIGDFCFVGAGAVVLPGVKIGSYAIIGAGAVVHKNVAEGVTVVGIPAKKIKD